MPEGHAIGRVDSGHAVIAPPVSALEADAVEHDSFTLTEIIWWVGLKTPRVTNTRKDGRARCGIANGRVSILIDGYARHKAPQSVTAIGPLLLLRSGCWERAAGDIELIPTNASRPVGVIQYCSLVRPQRFRPVAVLINHRCHDLVAKSIQLC